MYTGYWILTWGLQCIQDTGYQPGDYNLYRILDINLGTAMYTGYWILTWGLQCLQDTGY